MASAPDDRLLALRVKGSELVYWKEPKTSGLVFGSGVAVFVCLAWVGYPLLTVVGYLLMAHLVVRLVYRNGCILASNYNLMTMKPVPPPKDAYVSEEEVKAYAGLVADKLNSGLRAAYSVAMCDDNALMLKLISGLFFFSTFIKLVGTMGFLFLSWVLVFSGPKFYEVKKAEVDALLAKAEAVVLDLSKRGSEVARTCIEKIPSIPKASDLEHEKKSK